MEYLVPYSMTSNMVEGKPEVRKYKRKQKPRELCQICKCNNVTGWHFGARSCAACCAFFRRYTVNDRAYECLQNEKLCSIEAEKMLHGCQACKKCRVDRCLAAGMKKSAVESKEQKLVKPQSRKRASPPIDQEEYSPQDIPQARSFVNSSPTTTMYTNSSMEQDISHNLPSTSSISSPSSSFMNYVPQEVGPYQGYLEPNHMGFLPPSYRSMNEDYYTKVLSVLPEMRPELIKFQNWIERIDDPSIVPIPNDEFPLLNSMFLIMRQALSWREHLLGYPSESYGTSNASRYYTYSLHRKVVMTEYIVMKQVVETFYAFKDFSPEVKQKLVMNAYNYWLPFEMCWITAMYGDGTARRMFTHRIMHFDVVMDVLVNFVKSDRENLSKTESDCRISASNLHKFLTGHVPMLVSAIRNLQLNDYELAAVYLLILLETNKSGAPPEIQTSLSQVKRQLLTELQDELCEENDFRIGEIILLMRSIMETGIDFLESITLMDVCKRKIVYFALKNSEE